MRINLDSLLREVDLAGMLAIAVVDSISAMVVSEHSGADVDLELMAACASDWLEEQQHLFGEVQSIIICSEGMTQIIYPLSQSQDVFLYLVSDRTATLALDLIALEKLNQQIGASLA